MPADAYFRTRLLRDLFKDVLKDPASLIPKAKGIGVSSKSALNVDPVDFGIGIPRNRPKYAVTQLSNPLTQVGPQENMVQEPSPFSGYSTKGPVGSTSLEQRDRPGIDIPDIGVDEKTIGSRISQGKANLGMGTLAGLVPTLLASSKTVVPQRDDQYIDQMAKEVPDYIKNSQNASIDANTRSAIESVLSQGPLNRVSNTVAAISANGINAKSNLAEQNAGMDISLKNDYLQKKQGSLDQFNANVAGAKNQTIDSENTRLSNIGALGTNYFNESQNLINSGNRSLDQAKVLRSNQAMMKFQLERMLAELERYNR